jgi:hypothetical protein
MPSVRALHLGWLPAEGLPEVTEPTPAQIDALTWASGHTAPDARLILVELHRLGWVLRPAGAVETMEAGR